MLINGITVNTPFDDPVQFDPDWRHRAVVEHLKAPKGAPGLPSQLVKDTRLQKYLSFRRALVAGKTVFTRKPEKDQQLALRWYTANDTEVRYYLEALLLTEQPLTVIADDLGVESDVVRVYERLFFACRDDYGRTLSSNVLRTLFANVAAPNTDPEKSKWKFWAANLGYPYLVRKWGWANPHGKPEDMWARHIFAVGLAQEEFTAKLLNGKVNSTDLAMFVRGYFDTMMRDKRAAGEAAQTTLTQLGLELLKAIAPKIIPAAQQHLLVAAQAQMLKGTKAIEDGIKETTVEDKMEAGVDALNQQLRARLSKASV